MHTRHNAERIEVVEVAIHVDVKRVESRVAGARAERSGASHHAKEATSGVVGNGRPEVRKIWALKCCGPNFGSG